MLYFSYLPLSSESKVVQYVDIFAQILSGKIWGNQEAQNLCRFIFLLQDIF